MNTNYNENESGYAQPFHAATAVASALTRLFRKGRFFLMIELRLLEKRATVGRSLARGAILLRRSCLPVRCHRNVSRDLNRSRLKTGFGNPSWPALLQLTAQTVIPRTFEVFLDSRTWHYWIDSRRAGTAAFQQGFCHSQADDFTSVYSGIDARLRKSFISSKAFSSSETRSSNAFCKLRMRRPT
jgi:hypothetical protein